MLRSRLFSVLAAGACLVGAGGLLPGTASASASASGSGSGFRHGRVLPRQVFAPYFEAYTADSPAALAHQSGAKYLTMAFIQTPAAGSCTIDWNGNPATPIAASTYGTDIAKIRAAGGDVIPSFGGYGADHAGEEIADSCSNVGSIAAAYERVITTYNVTRLDLDTEDNSLTNPAGVDRRNQAIRMVEDWAARRHRTVQFVYTLPTFTTGLTSNGLAVLSSAVKYRARIDIANIMTFDYYDGLPHEMATDTEHAATALAGQLHTLFPRSSARRIWSMIGITEMVGIDDFGAPEIFTTADASTVEHWATSKGVAELSFWAIQRDNGGCPGTKGAGTCSGLVQSTWQFSHIFEPFTRR